ncbi:hypothetical protein DRN94_001095 [archaeon]|nr:hypothetical protein [archaeon]
MIARQAIGSRRRRGIQLVEELLLFAVTLVLLTALIANTSAINTVIAKHLDYFLTALGKTLENFFGWLWYPPKWPG